MMPLGLEGRPAAMARGMVQQRSMPAASLRQSSRIRRLQLSASSRRWGSLAADDRQRQPDGSWVVSAAPADAPTSTGKRRGRPKLSEGGGVPSGSESMEMGMLELPRVGDAALGCEE